MLKVQQSYLALFTKKKKKYKKHCSLIYNLLLSLQNQLGKVNKQQHLGPYCSTLGQEFKPWPYWWEATTLSPAVSLLLLHVCAIMPDVLQYMICYSILYDYV